VLEVAFAIPGDMASPTGGYAYARRLLELLPEWGVKARVTKLPGSFPHPTAADLDTTARVLSDIPEHAVLLADGLAYGALPPGLVAAIRNPIVALVHHPLGLESGPEPCRKAELLASEAAALAAAQRVIATSGATARCLAAEFGVRAERIAVAEPGVEPVARARGAGDPVQLLAVGAASPRKAYDVLVTALSGIAQLDWRLTIAGSLERDPGTARALKGLVAREGLAGRISLVGAVGAPALDALYDRADILVSASLFEGYGMVLAEAMARGVALIASTGGAAAETVPEGAGLKVPPGDADALRQALHSLITDSALRRTISDASWAAGQNLPRWSGTAAVVSRVLKEAAA
jgi:glycosyltransferase involved in cell wall biosynthesis